MKRIVSGETSTRKSEESSNASNMQVDSPRIFSRDTPMFVNNRREIGHATGFRCRECNLKSKHNANTGYCFIHKRIVDMNYDTCPRNTKNLYKNINL